MSAPVLWILFPFLFGVLILFLPKRYAFALGGGAAALLALTALLLPIDAALLVGPLSIKITASVKALGRSFILNAADGLPLAFIYGVAALWFFGVFAPNEQNRFVGLGLMIISLLVASIAVEPFLYAALLLEIAAMLALPLLTPLHRKAGRGVVRFLIYQTLAMPFILFAGWMLSGVEASPGDLSATSSSGVILLLGFSFLLGVFPLYNWIPMLLEETSPYASGFILWALSTFSAIFALGFLNRYLWLHTSPQFSSAFIYAGIFMAASAGVFSAAQKHLGRIMGYVSVFEMGLVTLALGLQSEHAVSIVFLLLVSRGLELTLWALALSILKREAYSLTFGKARGLARKYPLTVFALAAAHLSTVGMPLLAGFPARLALWQTLAAYPLSLSFWVFLGTLGALAAAARALAALTMTDENAAWSVNESWAHIAMLSIGVAGLFLLGMFPQIQQSLLNALPALFERLAR
ncbi:MAG: hypothetical protein Fur002_18840 [Anaerolineales bacterium]